nr:hypothetical protein [Mycobacterium persicum]
MWRGDYQGLITISYSSTIPEIPWHYDVNAPIEIPISGNVNEITLELFHISNIPIKVQLQQTICFLGYCTTITTTLYDGSVGGWALGPYTLLAPTTVAETIAQTFDLPGSGTLGPYTFGFTYQQSPGFFNSTTDPSSGFFNSGGGGASGLFNSAPGAVSGLANAVANSSGLGNAGGTGNSGYLNYGGLESGFANLGNTVSGSFNTSTVDLTQAAFDSGIGNVGTNLSGVFNDVFVP